MEEEIKYRVGICGLYCGTCPSFLAYRKNDSAMIRKLCSDKGMSAEELRCDGCLSDRVSRHCGCSQGFRECAEAHGVSWCFECTDFPCERLRTFRDVHIVNDISHHEHVIEDLLDMKTQGMEQWISKQEVDARCPACGETQYWFNRTCSDCGAKVR